MFDVGVPEAPGSCRQRMGHADVWELHQASEVTMTCMLVYVKREMM